jgi:imidazolonepropionase-like amidohydrolase
MKRLLAVACVTLTAALVYVRETAAQDLIVTNARILDGKGGVIERGSVVVRDGKIVSVVSGTPARVAGVEAIDAQGRTVMPGFIDAHRHIAQGDPAEWLAKHAASQMQEFLDAGFTTVLCAICPDQAIELRQRIESGAVKGPRLYLGSIIPLARAGAPGAPAAAVIPRASTTRAPHCVRRWPPLVFLQPRQSRPSRQWRAGSTTTSRP